MIRVVLDANIFISAVIKSPSNPARILELVKEKRIKIVSSNEILSEVRTALLYPKLRKIHHRTAKEINQFLKNSVKVGDIVPGKTKIYEVEDDPTDNKYLSAALEGKADFIVSGDHHLKDLKTFHGIRILDPATFLGLMTKLR
jgi:putative PIN family toxin of toxin-antitoxin system